MENTPTKKRFIETSSFYTNCEDEDPFSKMKIDDCSFLDEVPNRSNCPNCHKSRKYYCYTCYVAVDVVAKRLPLVKLPVKIDIIKHAKEVDGKSTSAHAAVLAPEDVSVYIYPDFPSYEDEEVLLIFPGPSAVPLNEWWNSRMGSLQPDGSEKTSSLDGVDQDSNVDLEGKLQLPFTKVVFIDSTWRQTKSLYSDPRLKRLPCVLLSSYKSLFWRYYREKLDTHLSTVEAVYHFAVELHALLPGAPPYGGQYDNVLFFFRFMYFKIRTLYDPRKIKAYVKNEGTGRQKTVEVSPAPCCPPTSPCSGATNPESRTPTWRPSKLSTTSSSSCTPFRDTRVDITTTTCSSSSNTPTAS